MIVNDLYINSNDVQTFILFENGGIKPCYKGYLEYYLDTEVEVYAMLNKIHNELVLNGYNAEACIIKDYLPSVVKEIEKVRRWTLDAENSDWDYTLIKIFDDKLHDKMKDVEE